MILRGASVADERLALEAVRVPLPEVPRSAVPAMTPVAATPSAESIVDWLEHSDGLSRASVAKYLASDIESLRLEAHADGFESGCAQGLQETRTRMEASAALLDSAVRAAKAALEAESAQLADLCADIIVAALTKIAGPILTSREAAVGAVVKILERVKDECELLIKVNHSDLPVLQELEGTLRRALGGRQFSIAADDSISLGGCIVGSQLGTFDGRVEIQLAGLLESIRGARQSREVSA
ncbi:MAG TPA: FliH/SctL family protein [Steroidobacteraceae bacterium]|nr:FliH/SctL family protein [Steroidobacteraceae bacterium]